MPDRGLGELQLLLVPPLRREVEDVVRAVEEVDAARVGRVGVEDGPGAVLVEGAHPLAVAHVHRLGLVVVEDGAAGDRLGAGRYDRVSLDVAHRPPPGGGAYARAKAAASRSRP